MLTLRLYKAERKKGARVHPAAQRCARPLRRSPQSAARRESVSSPTRPIASTRRGAGNGARGRRLRAPPDHHARGQRAGRQGPRPAPQRRPRATPHSRSPGKNGRADPRGPCRGIDAARLLMLGPNPALEAEAELLERALRKAACVVAIDTRPGIVSRYATVLIPGHAVFEKAGSVTNVEGRVQRIRAGLPPASATPGRDARAHRHRRRDGRGGLGIGRSARGEPRAARRVPRVRRAGNGGRAVFTAEAVA